MNIQTGETQISIDDIQSATPRKTAKLFQNGMRITNQSGENFDFVVYERDQWLLSINKV